ncbi:Folate-biopterin transporter [Parasponia andersonii]|uniref:Folate-biopterin transporter n=1 Tax=Parasponia andersonii TaxID=3476 RepID=A0A2P5D506_PARAD|nr:Folate-biopterin transporter [Parasponia andersonii]
MADSKETSHLIEKPSDDDPSEPPSEARIDHHDSYESSKSTTITSTTCSNRLVKLVLEPLQWLQMLSSQLNPSFVFGVILVYGFNQGFSGSFFKVVSDYYWKDVQQVQPSVVQLYTGLYSIPWVMKPIWGLMTDVFPVKGYRRRPYFVLAGFIGALSAAMVALGGRLAAAVALSCLIGLSAAMAIADVTIDACIARNSIEIRALASDLQSLCGFCSSAGALIGYSTSGFFVHHIGAQGSLGLLAAPPALLILLGFVIYEQKTTSSGRSETKDRPLVH